MRVRKSDFSYQVIYHQTLDIVLSVIYRSEIPAIKFNTLRLKSLKLSFLNREIFNVGACINYHFLDFKLPNEIILYAFLMRN